ncbi:MAG: glycosyltransferase family 2 protein [Armatimonadota bacterium]|nr:glycosyltransferase family 2 protein [Armatimonadota bacterium]
MSQLTFTVFTPTYNRAHLLGRAYESLRAQTFRDFEWIIVDDGSQDCTAELVRQWQSQAEFRIEYLWQPNSGKHVAVNRGVGRARGELFAILDSDDWLVPTALERIVHHWQTIPETERERYAGVCGLFADANGTVIGTPFPTSPLDADLISVYARYHVRGDKFLVNRTAVLKEFPFPEDLGRFVTEALVWNRIARKYITRFVNEVFAHAEYQPDGLSAQSVRLRAQSYRAACTYYLEYATLPPAYINLWQRVRAYANWIRFSMHGKHGLQEQFRGSPSKLCYLLALPIGIAAYYCDRYKLHKTERT